MAICDCPGLHRPSLWFVEVTLPMTRCERNALQSSHRQPEHFPSPSLGRSAAGEAAALPGKFWLFALCLFVAVMTLWLLLYPFDFQARRISSFLTERRFEQIHRINLVLNLVLFVPLGIITGWIWKLLLPRRSLLLVILVAADGAVLSAAGEYLQMWLPERTSSLIDLIANIAGSLAGGIIGVWSANRLTAAWCALARWLTAHPRGRRAFVVLVVVLLARAAPFDASLETYYLRTKFMYETRPAGLPFSATKQWLLPAGSSRANAMKDRDLAMKELTRTGLNFALFLLLAFTMARAMQEHRALGGLRGSTAEALALCLLIVVATEALQLPVRSRLMDATDPVAGAVGVLFGLVLALMRPRLESI